MATEEEKQGTQSPGGQSPSSTALNSTESDGTVSPTEETGYSPNVDDSYDRYSDQSAPAATEVPPKTQPSGTGGAPPKPPSGTDEDSGDGEEDHMLRMSFLQHLEELRSRILKALAG